MNKVTIDNLIEFFKSCNSGSRATVIEVGGVRYYELADSPTVEPIPVKLINFLVTRFGLKNILGDNNKPYNLKRLVLTLHNLVEKRLPYLRMSDVRFLSKYVIK